MSWHGSVPSIKSVKKQMSSFDSSVVCNLKVTYNDDSVWTIPLNKDGTVNDDEIRKKYIPLLENGSLFKKYGDFGIPKENYETILNLYQLYKQNSNYGKIPEDSIGFYDD